VAQGAGRKEPKAGGAFRKTLHPVCRHHAAPMSVIANGEPVPAEFPCTLEQFLRRRGLPPRSVVVELNGEAVAPSEFPERPLAPGDRLEIVRIVAGG